MTKTPTPTECSNTKGQHKNATKNFDYTTIADRLRTVGWTNNSHQTGVVKPVVPGKVWSEVNHKRAQWRPQDTLQEQDKSSDIEQQPPFGDRKKAIHSKEGVNRTKTAVCIVPKRLIINNLHVKFESNHTKTVVCIIPDPTMHCATDALTHSRTHSLTQPYTSGRITIGRFNKVICLPLNRTLLLKLAVEYKRRTVK